MSGIGGTTRTVGVLLPYHAVDSLLVFLYTLLTARGLGVEGFGLFATGVSMGATLFLLADFGLSFATTRDVAAGRASAPVLRTALAARITAALVLGVCALLMVTVAPHWSALAVVLGLAAGEALRSAQQLGQAILLGQHAAGRVALSNALEKLGILLPLALLTVRQGRLSLASVALAYGLGRIPAVLYSAAASSSTWRGRGLDLRAMANHTLATRHVGMFLVSERAIPYSLPLLLTLTTGVEATALFQAAFKMVLLPVSFFTALSAALYPTLARLDSRQDGDLDTVLGLALRGSVTFALGWVALFILCGPALIELVFGAAFAPAGRLLLLLLPYLVLSAVWQMSLYVLTAMGTERVVRNSSLLSVVLAAVTVILLGPGLGASAAPVALAVALTGAIGVSLTSSVRLRAGLAGSRRWLGLLLVTFVSTAAGAALLRLAQWHGPARIVVTVVFLALVFPAGVFLGGVLPRAWLRLGVLRPARQHPSP